MTPRLALATWHRHPQLYLEDERLPALLSARGVDARPAIWNDAAIEWRDFDAVLLRTTWDYFERLPEFLAWLDHLERAGVRLFNPPPLCRWNLDKHYLRDLEQRGVRVVPTRFVEPGESVTAAAVLAEQGWREAVIKPAVSGGAFRTRRVAAGGDPAEAERALAEVLSGGSALVQPFLREVVEEGEWSLLFFGGAFSHAVLKSPAAGDFRVQPQFGAGFRTLTPEPALIAEAARVVALAPHPPLYARVDGVRAGGHFLLMELEVLEPYLYTSGSPGALEQFASAVAAALDARG